jgi:hypothetical protein
LGRLEARAKETHQALEEAPTEIGRLKAEKTSSARSVAAARQPGRATW